MFEFSCFFESLGNLLGLPSWKLYHQQTDSSTNFGHFRRITNRLPPLPRTQVRAIFGCLTYTHAHVTEHVYLHSDKQDTLFWRKEKEIEPNLHFCLKISRRHFEVNVQLILIKINKLLGLWKWFTTWRRNGYPIHQEKDLLTSYPEKTPPASSSWHIHLGHE